MMKVPEVQTTELQKELTQIIRGINAALSAFPLESEEAKALLKDLKTAKEKLKDAGNQ